MPAIKLTGETSLCGQQALWKMKDKLQHSDFAKLSHLRVTLRWPETSVVLRQEEGNGLSQRNSCGAASEQGDPAGTGPGSTSCASGPGGHTRAAQDPERH